MQPSSVGARGAPRRGVGPWDLALSLFLLAIGIWAYAQLPAGSVARIGLVAPVLLFVPGYLALQAGRPAVTARTRINDLGLAVGVSPALVGMLALAAAVIPRGFRPPTIITTIVVGCVLLAAIAWTRRRNDAARARATHGNVPPLAPRPLPQRPN